MDYSNIIYVEPDQLLDFQPDLFITTSGFESRGIYIAGLTESFSCRKIALAFEEHQTDLARPENDKYFKSRNFEIVIQSFYKALEIESLINHVDKSEISIIIDISCMPKLWYFSFLQWFSTKSRKFSKANLRFTYAPADYSAPLTSVKFTDIKSFSEGSVNGRKNRNNILILGLGYEKQVAKKIVKLIQPADLYLYYADPSVDKQYVDKLYINNHSLIKSTSARNLIPYPIINGRIIYQKLIDVILPLRLKHQITLVPYGPKIFSLAAMIIHLGYPDINLSFPVFKKLPIIDRSSSGNPVTTDILFETE